MMLVYLIIFGDTSAQLFANLFNNGLMDVWYFQRYFYVLVLGGISIPLVLKKEIAELEWLAFVLFGSIGIFIICNLYLVCFDQNFRQDH